MLILVKILLYNIIIWRKLWNSTFTLMLLLWENDRREIFFIRLIVYMKRILRNGETFNFCKNTSCIRYCYYMKVIFTYVQISFVDLTLPLIFMQMRTMHFLILWKITSHVYRLVCLIVHITSADILFAAFEIDQFK